MCVSMHGNAITCVGCHRVSDLSKSLAQIHPPKAEVQYARPQLSCIPLFCRIPEHSRIMRSIKFGAIQKGNMQRPSKSDSFVAGNHSLRCFSSNQDCVIQAAWAGPYLEPRSICHNMTALTKAMYEILEQLRTRDVRYSCGFANKSYEL